ncbi:MAG: twin-arginine translocase subunit TatC [Alphaproteobacteria bacterium]|nr:twin-arginine translocase subunit TatC [Alphaproteobacteria bacterium]
MSDTTYQEERSKLVDHLLELRKRLVLSLGIMLVASIIAYIFAKPVYGFLVEPLAKAMDTGGESTNRLIYTNLAEAFMTYVKVALFAGIYATFPFLLSQIWLFMAPGLYQNEKRAFLPFLVLTPLLFYLGGALVYYVVIPFAWEFFLSFQSTGAETVLPIQLEARVSDYLDLVMMLVFAFGMCFQLPLVLTLLVRAGLLQVETLVKTRRYAIIGAFVIGAVLTPTPDIISQSALAIPLWLLYEISILFARQIEKKNNERFALQVPPAD